MQGRHIYTFENLCKEDTNLALGDDTKKVILNTKGIFNDVSPELKRLLDFIDGKEPQDDFTKELSSEVDVVKQNEKWRRDYMTLRNTDKDWKRELSRAKHLQKKQRRGGCLRMERYQWNRSQILQD